MATPKNQTRDCGLYRATKPLPGNEAAVPAGTLVYFHNHHATDSGRPLPSVIPPDHNVHNRWHFHVETAVNDIRSPSWVESLEKVPEQGFYTLRRELTFDGGSWPKGSIVQLGYTRTADPILFIARVRPTLSENDLFFSDKGVGIKRDQLSILEPAVIYNEPGDGTEHQTGPSH
ncbi:MAG: hypothetical protein QM820_36455 [Minicystis sp.]